MKSTIAPNLLLCLLMAFIIGIGLSICSASGTQPIAFTVASLIVVVTSLYFLVRR